MHTTFSDTQSDNGTASCQTPSHSVVAQKSGTEPDKNSWEDLFQGLKISTEQSKSHTIQFTDLPYEIVRHTARQLHTRSISALAQTCHIVNGAVGSIVIERIAHHYFGPPHSEVRRQYQTLCRPLARRLGSRAAYRIALQPEAREDWPDLYQITCQHILGQNGQHGLTCSDVLEQSGNFKCLTSGFSQQWGACALVCNKNDQSFGEHEQALSLVTLDPCTTLTAVPPIKQLQPHYVKSARILADGQIATVGSSCTSVRDGESYVLTLCQQAKNGTVEHVALAGTHSAQIVRIEQLPDGRIVSASLDGTLKIRPVNLGDEGDPQIVTLRGASSGITDMVLFPDSRCVTLTDNGSLTVWDLRLAPEKSCVATLTDIAQTIVGIHRLSDGRFLSDNGANELLVWQLIQGGASCTARLDTRWALSPYTTQVAAYELLVLPDRCLIVNHKEGACAYDLTASPLCDPHKDSTLQRTHGGDKKTQSLPLYPAGPKLFQPVYQLKATGLPLPDGRFVSASLCGDVHVYNIKKPASTDCRWLGNAFLCQTEGYKVLDKHKEYRPEISWMVGMGDGRLLATCETKKTTGPEPSAKTRFCVYDPYSRSTHPDNLPDSSSDSSDEGD